MLLALVLAACSGETPTQITDPGPTACDGRYQKDDGDAIDAIYDQDGDGYLDQNNAECAANYGANRLDCDDADAGIHPDAVEVTCNEIDDDCNPETADLLDGDLDGTPNCYDCDDDDPNQSPAEDEVCWDEVDNNCDERIDENCGANYSGTFDLSQRIAYGCLLGLVAIDFEQVGVIYDPPAATMYSVASGQPGTMAGTIAEDGSFEFTRTIDIKTAASCAEEYTITGAFVDEDNFTFDFTAKFISHAPGACIGCDNQQWNGITGTRAEGGR